MKSIGGFELETEDEIGSMAWGCWPETIFWWEDCPGWTEAITGESNMVLLQPESSITVTLEGRRLLTGCALNDDWVSPIRLFENFVGN